MGHQARREFQPASNTVEVSDLVWPFGRLDGIDDDDLRETAYEVFFTACRSSPGFGGGRHSMIHPATEGGEPASPGKVNGVGMAVTSRIKKALGLKMLGKFQSRRASSIGSGCNSPVAGRSRVRLPMTSAEIMRQQMRVTEPSDNRLRKTLMRILVGQMNRRAETIILPLELLRHLKPAEFNNASEYHFWQKRQLSLLQAGLLHHPSAPLDPSNPFAARLQDIIRSADAKAVDVAKNSESMRALCNCVVSLAWRSSEGSPDDVCHWADGYPLNVHIYTALLHSIFDLKDDTLILDEVDELLELMKKTWLTLGINRSIHNLCFTWVLFQQFVVTGEVEPELLGGALAMLKEVAADAKRADRELVYVKMMSAALNSMKKWAERRLFCYHGAFDRAPAGLMESLLPLVFSINKILEDDAIGFPAADQQQKVDVVSATDSTRNRVDRYIRSSLKYEFAKLLENEKFDDTTLEVVPEVAETLIKLAKETEELALKEKLIFSPVLKKWHPIPAGVAAMTLHTCYGTLLKQFMAGVSLLSAEAINVLHRAGKLEKVLVQMVVEDSADCEDGGKGTVREMVPYEVDSIISNFLKQWMHERLKKGKVFLQRAKETESWSARSKGEPYAHSAVELMLIAKHTVDDFFEIPLGISEDLAHDLADGLENIFGEFATFVASCGSKQSYVPNLPPLTRCSSGSKIFKLWRKASHCSVRAHETHLQGGSNEGQHPRPSTSRGTQRLFIRLNTLHYLLSQIQSLDKTLSLSPRIVPSPKNHHKHRHHGFSSCYFEKACLGIQAAIQRVSEVAAYRLIFLDSSYVFYDSLYVGDVVNSRIRPALRILKQNLTLLCTIVTERAQPLALKEVMRATFEAFLMVLLAGGSSRTFLREDHDMIEEDFDSLKRVFCACGEGLISEDVVEREGETVEGVVALMGQRTEHLVEDFSIVACEASGIGIMGTGKKLPMPPTTGRWHRLDPNTILRVLCHRNDRAANDFLKKAFQLAKRR
ncbi:protein unc-13 homolog [Diospyros lotus]|uniref:protein unc-13 homolog n=1 Tax=Diospyros lotus TaxID=55363 RepID=UPI002255ADC4|nr:protein unc-13 homolog [Diospyros lotus]XP_052188947.1 protein unc-13 homolog [Diospyros lotus]